MKYLIVQKKVYDLFYSDEKSMRLSRKYETFNNIIKEREEVNSI